MIWKAWDKVLRTTSNILREIKITLDILQRAQVRSSSKTENYVRIRINGCPSAITVDDDNTKHPHPLIYFKPGYTAGETISKQKRCDPRYPYNC